ncbi:hypothetical protein Pyn_01223 [Prunus yedoensis var. nudiflora]|uniref:Uncharacterized protein n=1 Tax=Prunus yedoensis var. nudiflora TaxID=2094558 RepID=A0A314ZQE1_PRUYE|nr:hypothetical protein Pyn_01223 [Prunus yedoensis var. nudiflora]
MMSNQAQVNQIAYQEAFAWNIWGGSLSLDQRRLERLLDVEELMPSLQDPKRFSFWM